jgi:hypothetical protein
MRPIVFLVDENAPRDIVTFLESRGHEVHYVGETFVKGSPDLLLLSAAEVNGYVIITFDKDFKQLIRQLPVGVRRRTERMAGRISFSCKETVAISRIQELIGIIEAHYDFAVEQNKRFVVQMSETSITSSL